MCLDAGWPPRIGKHVVTIYKCEAGNHNQAWAINAGQLRVKDTLS